MTLPGPDKIAKCPICAQFIRLETWASTNTFGSVEWTDGAVTGSMAIPTTEVIMCPHCNDVVWRRDLRSRFIVPENGDYGDEAEQADQDDVFGPIRKATASMVAHAKRPDEFTVDNAKAALAASLDRDRELHLRRMLWHQANNRRRTQRPEFVTLDILRDIEIAAHADANLDALTRFTKLAHTQSLPADRTLTCSIALISALRAHLISPVPDCILIALADLGRSETTMLSAMFKLFMAFTGQYDSPALPEWTSSERDNLLALAALLNEKDEEQRLEKAEILRQLGDWRLARGAGAVAGPTA